ncbi:hypothetical protein [Pararhizobium antarcticum]|uniref:DUF4440 domain-containing protein n=1 Tax=Pararhizobium antarcticum TaxID=1798805 RepID=A0A657LRG6_9HYPH|nr:hypothetical protein [Pararhizobium antarcticum]OJF91989.1 hypothetical protein AX761_05750 [Rhizobium sp. 58]OJF96058.1 hypothetical protein AX760_18570 [Pararhizobium antarcticum]
MLRRAAIVLLSATMALSTAPAFAQSSEEVSARIEQLHGDAPGFDEAFKLVTEAMKFGDPVTISDLGNYPLTVNANGETYDILAAKDLLDNYDTLVMQETQTAVSEQRFGDLIVNSDGVGFANGALWMAGICDTDDCSKTHWAIISINN